MPDEQPKNIKGEIMKPNRIYLACPYSHKDKAVEQERFELATKVAGVLIKEGHLVYSPLTHGHTLSQHVKGLGTDFEFYKNHCLSFIKHWADKIIVIACDGYDKSIGVSEEIKCAKSLGLPVEYLNGYYVSFIK